MASLGARGRGMILHKLKNHSEFAHKSDEKLQQLAHELTDFNEVFRRFSHLLDPVVDKAIDEALVDYRAVYTHSREVEVAHTLAKHELARVFHLPVKLFLSRLSQPIPLYTVAGTISKFFLEYGALHAGLIVGNIRIEWGQESIVEALPEDDIPSDDFVGTVDVRQGHLARVANHVQKNFSLAHQQRRIDDKVKLIIDTAEKKKEVIGNLVRVITCYNLEKKYDLFTCNCQHFVRDALAALGIKEPPRFSGQLKHYLERLKQGKVEVPEDFKNHDTLDAYVEQQLQAEPGTLNQHDMEYLLLHYYRIHLNSMPDDGADNEEWQCSVPSCKCEDLADRVNRESLLNNQFPPRSTARPLVSSAPTVEEHSVLPGTEANFEEAEIIQSSEVDMHLPEVDPRRREQQETRDEQRARQLAAGVEQDEAHERHKVRGYYARVVAKLRRLPDYTEVSEEEVEEAVTNLTDFEPFRTKYDCFPAAVEETSKGFALEATADHEWIEAGQLPHIASRAKVEERYEKLSKLPVKLVLQSKQVPGSVFDARLDAVLLIFDHVLKWDESSLVIPRRVNLKQLPPSLMTPILHGSEWSAYINNQRSKLQTVVQSRSDKLHKKEIDLIFKLTTKKDIVISAVINTVIHYNRHKQYDERDCNNLHFIYDVTTAMGIKKLPVIGESLGALLERSRLLCVETLPRTEFVDHADLDDFIRHCCESSSLSELGICDVEYLIIKYFHFHVRHWELSHYPDQWTCQEPGCQLKKLEKLLEKLALSDEKKCVIL